MEDIGISPILQAPERSLTDHDLEQLRASGLSDVTIAEMGCYSVNASTIRCLTGNKSIQSGGFAIPYEGILDQTGRTYTRFRLSEAQSGQRYVSGTGDGPQLYIPNGIYNLPSSKVLVVTEGEKKAAKGVQEGIHVVAIQGVTCWASSPEREAERASEVRMTADTVPLSALLSIAKKYDKVLILGDSDIASNPRGQRSLETLRDSLISREVRTALAFCPPNAARVDGEFVARKQGLDDWLSKDRHACLSALPALFFTGELAGKDITDYVNAIEIKDSFGDRLARSFDTWLRWDGTVWRDEKEEIYNAAHALTTKYGAYQRSLIGLLEAIHEPVVVTKSNLGRIELKPWSDPTRLAIRVLSKGISKVEGRTAISNALVLAQTLLKVSDDVWDQQAHLLSTPGGVVDLRTGDVIRCAPELRITHTTPVAFDPDARAPLFEDFLRQVQPDAAMRDYLQRVLGSCAFGDAREQKFFLFHGTGANGKSVLMDVASEALGTYATKASAGLLAERSAEHPQNDLAGLRGRRLVSVSELPANFRLDEARVKTMTGGDKVTARFLYKENFTFRPNFTLVLDTNHQPIFRNPSAAIWRRLVVMPWSTAIAEENQDKGLATKLRSELPGILSWIVRGAIAFHKRGLETPARVKSETVSTRIASDPLQNWIDEFVQNRPGVCQQSSDVYSVYREWTESQQEEGILSQKAFSQALRDKGFKVKKIKGLMYWVDFQSRNHNSEEDDQHSIDSLVTSTRPFDSEADLLTDPTETSSAIN